MTPPEGRRINRSVDLRLARPASGTRPCSRWRTATPRAALWVQGSTAPNWRDTMTALSARTRAIAGSLAGLAIVAGATGVAAAQTAPAQAVAVRAPQAVVQTGVLSADAALKIADAVQKEAVKQGQRVTVVIVDRSGATRLVLKGDGAGPQT